MSQFQVKYFDKDDWKEISEIDVLRILIDEFGQVTPSVTKMLEGREIIMTDGILRMKNYGNEGKDYSGSLTILNRIIPEKKNNNS
jgi:hypothetical protein